MSIVDICHSVHRLAENHSSQMRCRWLHQVSHGLHPAKINILHLKIEVWSLEFRMEVWSLEWRFGVENGGLEFRMEVWSLEDDFSLSIAWFLGDPALNFQGCSPPALPKAFKVPWVFQKKKTLFNGERAKQKKKHLSEPQPILLMAEILHQLRLVVYPIIYKVSYIPGGAGFQPSTVGCLPSFDQVGNKHVSEHASWSWRWSQNRRSSRQNSPKRDQRKVNQNLWNLLAIFEGHNCQWPPRLPYFSKNRKNTFFPQKKHGCNQQPNRSSSACGQLEGTAERKILIPWIRLKFGEVWNAWFGSCWLFWTPPKKKVGSKLVSKLGYFMLFHPIWGGLINTKLTGLHHSYGLFTHPTCKFLSNCHEPSSNTWEGWWMDRPKMQGVLRSFWKGHYLKRELIIWVFNARCFVANFCFGWLVNVWSELLLVLTPLKCVFVLVVTHCFATSGLLTANSICATFN